MERNYGWVIVAAGAVITCLAMGSMFALPVYLQPIAEETGWTRAGISAAMTIGFLSMGIGGFLWGTLSDRIGARPVVLLAAVILLTGFIIASRATDLVMFQLSYGILVGASGGAFFAPIMATTVGWFDKNRSLAVSLVSLGTGVAPMIMTPLASYLIEIYGWRSTMLMISLGAFAVMVPCAMLIRKPENAVATADDEGPSAIQGKPSGGMLETLARPQFIVLAATFFLCCGAHSGPIFHTVSYAVICGASPLAAASIYSVEGVAGLFGRLFFGLAADRLGVRRVLVAGLLLQAAGIYTYIYVSELTDFYMLAMVLGMAYGGVMPLYAVLARDYFRAEVMGTVLGAATLTSCLGMALGPIGGGWLYDTYGTYYWLYIASAAVGLAAAAMALAFPPPARQEGGEVSGKPGLA
jgi:predicted MFS family arabinose efflux permease